MAAYDLLIELVKKYFCELNYNNDFVDEYFCNNNFSEIVSIKLANANVMIRNKTYPSSHQTHIAITGEAINYFYSNEEFEKKDNDIVEKKIVFVSPANISDLNGIEYDLTSDREIELICGHVTVGKRTQKQVQLSKRNSSNSVCFNSLRLGLYENDLLILMKIRGTDSSVAIGISKKFYNKYINDYDLMYETNTYLRLTKGHTI